MIWRRRMTYPSVGRKPVMRCRRSRRAVRTERRAADWVKENIGATANPPVITEGGTVVYFSSKR